LIAGHTLYGQTPVVETSSATNGEVKIHSGKRMKKFRGETRATERQGQSIGKSLKGTQARKTERQGQSISKQQRGTQAQKVERPGRSIRKDKPHRNRRKSGEQAKVFKRHNHFAKEKGGRVRPKKTASVLD
jgi:hypothetical protein